MRTQLVYKTILTRQDHTKPKTEAAEEREDDDESHDEHIATPGGLAAADMQNGKQLT